MLAILVLALLACSLPAADEAEYHEEVSVGLTLFRASVLDRRGESVPDLRPEDFEIYEDGRRQDLQVFGEMHSEPVRVAFLLDISGSMRMRGKLPLARTAIRRFASALRPDDEVALLVFADGDVVVASPFSRRRQPLLDALESFDAFGRTALLDAVAEAPGLLDAEGAGRKALILVTDGIDNHSTLTRRQALILARAVPVPVYVLRVTDLPAGLVGAGRSAPALTTYARATGGELFPLFDGDDIASGIESVSRRLRGQYLLGYATPRGEAGFRRIEVRTRGRGQRVEARSGYYLEP